MPGGVIGCCRRGRRSRTSRWLCPTHATSVRRCQRPAIHQRDGPGAARVHGYVGHTSEMAARGARPRIVSAIHQIRPRGARPRTCWPYTMAPARRASTDCVGRASEMMAPGAARVHGLCLLACSACSMREGRAARVLESRCLSRTRHPTGAEGWGLSRERGDGRAARCGAEGLPRVITHHERDEQLPHSYDRWPMTDDPPRAAARRRLHRP